MDTSPAAPTADQDVVNDLRSALYGDLVTYAAARTALGGVSRWTLSKHVREGSLVSQRINGKYYITRDSLGAFVAALKAAARRPSAAGAKSPAA